MTTIGASVKITGEVQSHEDVTIHGTVKGKVTMTGGALLVSAGATVEADAQGSHVQVHGGFVGDITASARVELSSTAQMTGTLIAPAVVIHDGAVFNGAIEVTRGLAEARKAS